MAGWLALVGLVFGSFLTVVAHRVPRKESLFLPPSRCDHCARRLAPWELVPVLSWLALRGRCAGCGGAIPWQYPLLEVASACCFVAAGPYLPAPWPGLTRLCLLLLLITVAVTDLSERLVPDRLLLAALVLGIPLRLAAEPAAWLDGVIGGLAALGSFLLLAVLARGGLGGGDVKLAGVMGWFLGWQQVWLALVLAACSGAAWGLALVALRRRGLRESIAFAPFLALGGAVMALWGPRILDWYWGLG